MISNNKNPLGLFKRHEKNPILTAQEWPYPVNTVFNAAATRFNGQTLLLVRVENLRGMSHLTVARSQDGLHDWKIDSKPTLAPDPDNYPEELWGIEDPRIVYLESMQQYAITYTAFSRGGPLVALALTKDFEQFKRCGAILPIENKDAAFFPRQINGKWYLIHRPVPGDANSTAHIWLAESEDLVHWGKHKLLMMARQGGWWDAHKIGLGPPPIETEEGWLVLYHGVRVHASGSIYRLGLALLDLENPAKVIRRSKSWVFGPTTNYERTGDVANANFPCGVVLNHETKQLFLYYGAADTCMAVATANLSELLDFLRYDSQT